MSADPIATSYKGISYSLHFEDSHEGELPSNKFGVGAILGVWLAVIFFSFLFVVSIIMCSRMQEKRVSDRIKRSQDMKKQTQKDIKNKLPCKPWCPESPEMGGSITSTTEGLESSSDSGSSNGDSGVKNVKLQGIHILEDTTDVESQNRPGAQPHHKNGTCCAICTEEYQPGQPVVQSNNPHCSHMFHKICLDKWLDFQNTCPVCNQPYFLQTV